MLKGKKGFTTIDVLLAVITVIIFTSIIVSLMYNVRMENLRITSKLQANVLLTETLENIGIAKYEEVDNSNANLIPDLNESFQIKLNVLPIYNEGSGESQNLIKRVEVTVYYSIGDKIYEETIQRLKIKE